MSKRNVNKKIIWGIAVVALTGAIALSMQLKPGVEVNGIVVSKSTVEKFVEEKGVVRAVSSQKVYAKVHGEVEEIMVLPGDRVKRGDQLATLVATDYELRVLAMEAQKKALDKTLEELLRPQDAERLNIALGDVTAAKNTKAQALKDFENAKALYDTGGISQGDLNTFKSVYNQSVIAVRQAEETYDLLKKGSSEQVLDQTRAQIEALTYELQLLKTDKERLAILSTVSGTVVDKSIEKGQILMQGDLVYEIADLSQLYIEVELLVSDATQIQVGSPVEISLENTELQVTGRVERIYPKAFSKVSELGVEQKRIQMDLALDSQVPILYGAEVQVKIFEVTKASVLCIPDSAVFDLKGIDYVFVVEDGMATLKAIEKGLVGNRLIEIISGLAENQVVIDTPDTQLADGDKVKVNLQVD